jgi:hypothetical protein
MREKLMQKLSTVDCRPCCSTSVKESEGKNNYSTTVRMEKCSRKS